MINRKAPDVVTGMVSPAMRSGINPETQAAAQIKAQAEAASRMVKSRKDGEVVFQSRYHGYRYQVTSPADVYNPTDGTVTKGRPVHAQFVQGEFRTSDPKIIARLKGAPEFGIGRDYWDAEEFQTIALNRSVEALAQTVKNSGDPALIERVVAELLPLVGGDKTFKMPEQPAEAGAEPQP